MFEKIAHKWCAFIFLVLSITSLGFSFYFFFHRKITTERILAKAYEQSHEKAITASRELDGFISLLKPLAHKLADELSTKKLSKAEIEKRLREKPVEISGFNVTFVPHVYDKDIGLYSPYYTESEGEQKLMYVESLYDYTKPEHTWYHKPLKEGAQFLEPYFGTTQETIFLEYSVPFYRPDDPEKKVPAGLVSTDLTMEHMRHVLFTLYKGQEGYWFIITKQGTFVHHPKSKFVLEQKTIFDIAKKINDPNLADAAQRAMNGEKVFIEYNNEVTGVLSWLFFEPLQTPGWVLGGVFEKGELVLDTDTLRREFIHLIVSSIFFIINFILFLLCLYRFTISYAWFASFFISIMLAFGIASLWYLNKLYPDYHEDLQIIKDKKVLYEFIKKPKPQIQEDVQEKKGELSAKEAAAEAVEKKADYLTKEQRKQLVEQLADPNHVPTGIYVNNIQFAGPNQINVVCYIWQRYFTGIHDELSRGFILPQASNATITELYRRKEKTAEIIIWNVQATLNQNFIYADYPFDAKDFRIQLWHKDFEKKVILIPDLDAYVPINPRSLPGMNVHSYIGGWSLEKTYFGYGKTEYNTIFGIYKYGSFGIYGQVDKSMLPELYFNILATRNILDTLWSDLLPLIIMAAFLFIILLTFELQGWAILGSCATIFFGVLLAQVRFRTKIPSYELVYFESFFFVLYSAILAVIIVSLLYQLKFDIPLIRYRKNIIAKLLYWPSIILVLLLITIVYLY